MIDCIFSCHFQGKREELWIDLNYVRFICCFRRVFSRASEKLFVSQPAVSQTIKQLENQVGFALFVRKSKGIHLTPEGDEVFAYCKDIFRQVELLSQNLKDLSTLDTGVLTIGASDTICKYYLIDKLKAFENLYPKVRYRVTNCTTNESIELLKKGSVDIAFVHTPFLDTTLSFRNCLTLHDCFVCSSQFDDSAISSLSDLKNYRILLLEGMSHSRRLLDANLLHYGVTVKPKFELASLDLLIEFCKNNMGIICVAKEYIKKELENGELKIINIKEPLPDRYISLITYRENYISNAAKRFVEHIK